MSRARLLALLLPLVATLVPGPIAAAGHTVRITSTLNPATLTIAPGDTVTFRNDDGERHRMRSRSDAEEFDTSDLEPGETYRVSFTTPGRYAYIDERDDDDQRYWGTIVVAESTPDPTDDGGGSGGGGGTSGGGGTGGGGAVGGGGSAAPSTATIRLADRAFSPQSVTIAAGGSITWRNDDDRDHTATSTGDAFDSGLLRPAATHRESFPAAGSFPFLCIIHPEMTGTITVVGGGSDAGSGGPAATPRPTPKSTPRPTTGSAPDGPASVAIVDLDFEPAHLEITAGASVTWTNTGVAPHSATADDGSFDTGILDAGAGFTETFDSPGTFAYACVIHPSMTGSIVVRRAAVPATASPTSSAGSTASPSATASPPPGEDGAAAGDGAALSGTAGEDPPSAPASDVAQSIIATVLAIALIAGALMVGAGLILGALRREGGASTATG